MQEIVNKYENPLSKFLLPIIKPMNGDERTQYQNAQYLINRKLKEIGKMAGVELPLTMYVARHSWASVAKNKNIPIIEYDELKLLVPNEVNRLSCLHLFLENNRFRFHLTSSLFNLGKQ